MRPRSKPRAVRQSLAWCSIAILAWSAVHVAAAAPSWESAGAEIAACFAAMDKDPGLAVVNAKFARRDPTAEQLADPNAATEAESEALRARVRKTKPCRELRLAAVNAFHPNLEPAYATLYYQTDQVFQYLTNGLIAYGSANRLSLESFTLFQHRTKAYFAAGEAERQALANVWSEALQRAHSNPPPGELKTTCAWRDLNLACD